MSTVKRWTTEFGNSRVRWSDEEDRIIIENYPALGITGLMNLLPGRSYYSIQGRVRFLQKLGMIEVKKRERVDAEKFVELWVRGASVKEIADFFGVNSNYVHQLRRKLGLPCRRSVLKREGPMHILKTIQEEGGYCELIRFPKKSRRLINELVEKRQAYKVSFREKCGKRLRSLVKPEYARKTFICSSTEAVVKLISSALEKPKSRGDAKAIAIFLNRLGLTAEEAKLTPFMGKRGFFVARADLLERLSEMAEKRGYTLTATVNEIFEKALKADAVSVSVDSLVEEKAILNAAREAGFTLGLESLWHGMTELAYRKARDEASKIWFEAGVSLAKRYTTGDYDDPLSAFKDDLEKFTLNTAELNIQRIGNLVKINITSPNFPESYAFFMSRLIEGALKTFGYKVVESETLRGFMRIQAEAVY
jgi:hypothetical protein